MIKPLLGKDIEEKILLNLKDKKFTLPTLREALEKELFEQERTTIRSMVQSQNLREQIAYIDKKIKGVK